MRKVKSTFALLDVLGRDRHDLANAIPGTSMLKGNNRIPVVINGFISHRWGNDDGTSIEFGVDVTNVTIIEGHMAKKPTAKTTKKPAAKAIKKPAKAVKRKAA